VKTAISAILFVMAFAPCGEGISSYPEFLFEHFCATPTMAPERFDLQPEKFSPLPGRKPVRPSIRYVARTIGMRRIGT
jgi:hypothetical protein